MFDQYSVLIPRNTAIPCTKAESFFTLSPEQDSARVRVYQGDNTVASRNVLLGEFLFDGISPAPAGENREVIVRFDYDVNGIVQVSAIDRQTSRSESLTITASQDRLSAADKARSVEKLAAVDRRLEREIATLIRRAERLMTRLEADGRTEAAEELLTRAGDLERARQQRDYDQARVLTASLGDLIYSLQH
jgi:molecular chaperone DnaK (HSP70)